MKSYLCAILLLVFSPLVSHAQSAEEKPDEVQVTIVPKKGMKFDPKAIERDDQSVLQGIFGTTGDDQINDLQLLPSKDIIAVGKAGVPAQIPATIPRAAKSVPPGAGRGEG